LEKIYNKTLIKKTIKLENEEHKGFYLYSCTKLEKEMIQLYIFLTGNLPIPQNILLCNQKTSNEEVTAFLYRAILCEFNSCFIIGGIESLKFNQKNYFIEILNQILNEVKGKFKSCFIILSNDKSSDLYKSLDSINYKKTFNKSILKDIDKIKIDKLDKIIIITSDEEGVGKSTKIKNDIEKKGKEYIYFPFGGVFTRNDIIQKLKNLKINKNTAIHLDLYYTDCIDLIKEFLFWILIAKMYKVKEDIFYFLDNIEIYIEISNGFTNFFEIFPIFEMIPQMSENELLISKMEPLIISNKINSKIQIVCNFLKLFKEKKIDDYNLNIPGITFDDIQENNSQNLNAELISQNECQKLIYETLRENNKNIKFFNYYQIQSFIDILADGFLKFSHNNNFNVVTLINNHLRSFILEELIKLSNYFIQNTFK